MAEINPVNLEDTLKHMAIIEQDNKRMMYVILVLLALLFLTVIYIIYLVISNESKERKIKTMIFEKESKNSNYLDISTDDETRRSSALSDSGCIKSRTEKMELISDHTFIEAVSGVHREIYAGDSISTTRIPYTLDQESSGFKLV